MENFEKTSMSKAEALCWFDKLETIGESFMIGSWKGRELRTGHPMEGLLEASGWYGKFFPDRENVHPLVFAKGQHKFSGKPAVLFPLSNIPVPKMLIPVFMLLIKPLIRTRHSKARLRMVEYRGKASATMIYDELPICDHFRKIDANRVLGAMDSKGTEDPYFFILEKEA